MARIIFNYSLTKARKSDISKNGYDVILMFRTPDGVEMEKARHKEIKKLPRSGSFPEILSAVQIRTLDVRLRIARSDNPASGCFTTFKRLALPPTTTTADIDLGSFRLSDSIWNIAGTILPEPDFDIPLDKLRVKLQVRSSDLFEEPATLNADESGAFSFDDRRMVLDPESNFETLLTVVNEADAELARHYSEVTPGQQNNVQIKIGAPFLDLYEGFRQNHPTLTARLERFGFEPKRAHENDDAFFIFRRWKLFANYQAAEGVVGRAKQGPAGDPDFTWDVRLDPFFDSDEGFRLPNDNNRIRHGGLHVEACKSLSRARIPDGLTADADTVPAETRVWMLGTHVFDDAQDFGSPGHEHNELHPLYVMEPCMGGWFHFATFESIALAPEAQKDDSPPRARWPWTETTAQAYRDAYIRLNPRDVRDEIAQSYSLILDRFRREGDDQGIADFFADTSVRYSKLGVDIGVPLSLSTEPYRASALEMLGNERKGRTAIQALLADYLARLFRFLYGPASMAQSPIKGPAPQSFLRCVYAMENEAAASATNNSLGEPNPRVSLNRATSRKVETIRIELSDLYSNLFDSASANQRAELFSDAALRYRSLAVNLGLPTDEMDREQLVAFARNATPEVLAEEMGRRVNTIWNDLTPYLRT
jgi:hypothetical protein